MARPVSCGLFLTTPVGPCRTGVLNIAANVLKNPSAPQRPVQHLPKKHCLTPTQGVLLAGNHAPTLTIRPGAAGQRPTTATNLGKGCPVGVGVPSPSVSGDVACRDEGTEKMVKTRVAKPPPSLYQQPQGKPPLASVADVPTNVPPCIGVANEANVSKLPLSQVNVSLTGVLTYVACQDDGTGNTVKMTSVEKVTRRGKIQTGGRRPCTLMVCFLCAATLLMVDVVQAVFAPADINALKDAVDGCLGETADGSCPTFAASNDATGNPYGVIGAWDVSAVTSMKYSKCTLSRALCGNGALVFEYYDNSSFI
jgi:hypothetical protein